MTTILDKILAEKEKEVAKLLKQQFGYSVGKKVPTFKERVQKSKNMSIIAEIKRSSPSKGAIDMGVDPVAQAINYESLGATAISVLTDKPFFNGTMDDLRAVREAVNIPILCKDFIIHKVQIDHAKAAGANIILLIVAALSHSDLVELYEYAKSLDLEVLVEVHDVDEMERALNLEAEIIGINNRNLKTFEVNLDTTEQLASMVIDPNTILISESGMKTKNDIEQVAKVGAKAVLVGETFMLAEDLAKTFKDFQVKLPGEKEATQN